MELFNRLFVETESPPELAMLFISNWIQETSKVRDPTQKMRLARLVGSRIGHKAEGWFHIQSLP